MKKIASIFGMLMFISAAVFAGSVDADAATGLVIARKGSTFKVFYKGAEMTDVKVSIYDNKNNVVYSEMIRKTEGFVRPYNFFYLPEGEYTIKVTDKRGVQMESVKYQHDKIESLSHLRQIDGTQKFILTIPNKDATIVKVKIRDTDNNVIYENEENISGDFGKVYNLEKFSGDFVFDVTYGDGITRSLSYQ